MTTENSHNDWVAVPLEGGPLDQQEVQVIRDISSFVVPVPAADGFGKIMYRPTGRFNDGREIWATGPLH